MEPRFSGRIRREAVGWGKIAQIDMALSAGTQLGPYEILSPLGAGGMGEVYKARDTRLDRIVAIKVSNEKFSERFEREARAVAALNHTHICTLHDVGPDYLVMEYIEGEPVVSQKKPEPRPLPEALRLAIQITEALEAAHGKGILHRDLKPSNILVAKSGVKLLDFGLAKLAQPGAHTTDDTITNPLTAAGEILGTVQYMSPEQLQGQEADARSDIFSFGLVLYEMLTGRRAFQGSSQASLIAAILKEEPQPLTSLQPLTPPALDRTVSKCLAKDPGRRWQSAVDLRDELTWIAESGVVAPAPVSRRSFLPWIAGSAAAGAGAAGLAMWAWGRKSTPAPREATRFRLAPPEGAWIARVFTQQSLALSPVGRRLAMIATGERGSMVWVQRLDSLTATPLQGTEGATMVFWSPDGQFIGFWAGGKIKKIPAEGGTPLPICDLSGAFSATWNQDNLIVAQTSWPGACVKISVQSGVVSPGRTVNWPKFLPGGKHLLYVNLDPMIKGQRAYVAELSTGRETALMATDTQVTFTPDQPGSSQGHLLFGRSATLLALRFDADRLSVMGEPVPVAKDVPFFFGVGWSEFDTSFDGVLIYSTGSQEAPLTWLDRGGRELGPVGLSRDFFGCFRLSPDGKKIAADVFDFSNGDAHVWIYDLSQATTERMTLDPGFDGVPVWSPDGTKIAYGGAQAGPIQLRVKAASDQGSERFPPGVFQVPTDWSSDGRWIFYQTNGGEANAEIWVASVAEHKVMPLLQTRVDSSYPALSPSGELLAFSANDTGRSEIYVQRFEGGDSPKLVGPRRRVSRDGGNGARWRRDGKELFFLSPNRQIMAMAVPQAGMEFGPPAALFRLPTSYRSLAPVTPGYEVSSDGQKFLVPIRKAVGAPLQVVVNWQARLKG
jgi:Tol biopolymer transport system component/predicted Ser/Thr protein kinase